MGASEAAGAGSAATEDASSGWWGEGSLVRSISGKVGGWFATPAVDLETRARHLATLRERFPDFPPEDAARFLSARGDALDSAAEMIDKHLVWRAETLPVDPDHPGVRAELDKGVFRRVGRDVEGRPVLVFAAHRNKPNDRVVEHVIRMMVHVIEDAIAAIPKAKESDTHEEKDDPSDAKDAAGRDAGGDGLDTFSRFCTRQPDGARRGVGVRARVYVPGELPRASTQALRAPDGSTDAGDVGGRATVSERGDVREGCADEWGSEAEGT